MTDADTPHPSGPSQPPYTDVTDNQLKARIRSLLDELNAELEKAADIGVTAEIRNHPVQRIGRRTAPRIDIKLSRAL